MKQISDLHEDGVCDWHTVSEVGGQLRRFPCQSQRVAADVRDQRLMVRQGWGDCWEGRFLLISVHVLGKCYLCFDIRYIDNCSITRLTPALFFKINPKKI